MDINEIKAICSIPSTSGLLDVMCKYNGQEDDPFKEKVYRLHLTNELDMEFSITKHTSTPAFPVYLTMDVCTDPKKLAFDLINTKGDRIDFGQQMLAFGVARKSFSEAVKEFGYFGDDPTFYEGLVVYKKIVLKQDTNYIEITDDIVNSIEQIEIKKEENNEK